MKVPGALIDSLRHLKGFDKEAFEKVHESGSLVTSIRLNTDKLRIAAAAFPLAEDFEHAAVSAVPWSHDGRYLSSRPSFTADPLFHAGAYYVQEASSMFLEEVLKQSADLSQPLKVLDLCAAPGGKSALIQSVISEKSLLVSNEVIKSRAAVLSENLTKWGSSNVIVTNNLPRDFKRMPAYFDVVMVDAPCSGSGLFRKDPDAVKEWSLQQVELCSRRQQGILADILPALKKGGLLIYSTCSFSKEENEDICDLLIKDHQLSSVSFQLKQEWNIIESISSESHSFGYRFYPDKLKGEGFFIAAFKKGQTDISSRTDGRAKTASERLTRKEIDILKPWLKNAADFFFIKQNDEVIALPDHLEKDLSIVQSSLYIRKAGVKLGAIIRSELVPCHELALGNIIGSTVPVIEADKETALQYLRKQEIKTVFARLGWVLLTYRQLPLGWIKVLPNG